MVYIYTWLAACVSLTCCLAASKVGNVAVSDVVVVSVILSTCISVSPHELCVSVILCLKCVYVYVSVFLCSKYDCVYVSNSLLMVCVSVILCLNCVYVSVFLCLKYVCVCQRFPA